MEDCLFCKIIAGEIPGNKVYEDEWVYAFRDINPIAPFHVLLVPKVHIKSAAEITPENSGLVARIFEAAAQLAAENHLTGGFRIATNCGPDACQTVLHMHFHMIGGRPMTTHIG